MNITKKQAVEAFEEWDRRFRDNPEDFENFAVSLLTGNPETYGEAAAPYFFHLVKELAEKEK